MRNGLFYFVSDLHGRTDRFEKLFESMRRRSPKALLIGGDILPRGGGEEFLHSYLYPKLKHLRGELNREWPWIGVILGNDDPVSLVPDIMMGEDDGLWFYLHKRMHRVDGHPVFGYSCVPPTPFLFKDWERYDVSRYVDPGCIPPEEGIRSLNMPDHTISLTIQDELEEWLGDSDMREAIFLFHSPPHQTNLDRLGGGQRYIDHAPIDMHVGSIAIRRFIEKRQPLISLHGHIHESASVTGSWKDRMQRTRCFSAAHEGAELALVIFSPDCPDEAERKLI